MFSIIYMKLLLRWSIPSICFFLEQFLLKIGLILFFNRVNRAFFLTLKASYTFCHILNIKFFENFIFVKMMSYSVFLCFLSNFRINNIINIFPIILNIFNCFDQFINYCLFFINVFSYRL